MTFLISWKGLDDHEVYVFKKGRYLDDDDLPVADIISVGFDNLISTKASPLNDYNKAFLSLQARRQLQPLFPPAVLNPDSTQPSKSAAAIAVSGTHNLYSNPNHSSVSPLLPQPVADKNLATDSGDSSDEESEADMFEFEDQSLGEFLYSFEGESFEPSLVLATSADVSLDMDAEDVGDGGDGLSDDDDESDGAEHGDADSSISETDVDFLDSDDKHN